MEKAKYVIEYLGDVEDKLRNLTRTAREMVRKAIEKKLMTDPVAFGNPLKYSLKGHRRLRVGDYRVIFKIIEDKVLVVIIDIDHRRGSGIR